MPKELTRIVKINGKRHLQIPLSDSDWVQVVHIVSSHIGPAAKVLNYEAELYFHNARDMKVEMEDETGHVKQHTYVTPIVPPSDESTLVRQPETQTTFYAPIPPHRRGSVNDCIKFNPVVLNGNDDQFEVEAIVAAKRMRSRWVYLIKWTGCSFNHNTWLNEKDIHPDLIKEFRAQNIRKLRGMTVGNVFAVPGCYKDNVFIPVL